MVRQFAAGSLGFFRFVLHSTLVATALLLAVWLYAGWRYGSWRAFVAVSQGQAILIDDVEQDLGDLVSGQKRRVTYRITNLLDHPIRLLGSQVSCACGVVGPLPQELDPGRPWDFIVEVTAPEPTEGERIDFGGSVKLFTNQVNHPIVRLTYRGKSQAVSVLSAGRRPGL